MRFNNIISKILLVYGIFSFLFVIGSFLIWKKQKNLLIENSIERRKKAELVFDKTVQTLSNQVKTFTYDYTYWDETAAFVGNPTKEWAKVNIEETIPKFNISFIWVLNQKFEPVYSYNILDNHENAQIPLDNYALREIIKKEKFPHFFLSTKDYLLELCGAPIQMSEDFERLGKPFGYMFTARVWDKNYIETLQQQTQSEIRLVLPKDIKSTDYVYNPQTNPEYIIAQKTLKDYKGNTILFLSSLYKDNSINMLKTSYNLYSTIWYSGGAVLLLVLLFLMNMWIFKPIKVLSKSISSSESNETSELLLLAKTNNVFGDYAKLLINFIKQKKFLEDETKKRKLAEEALLIKSSAVEQSPVSIMIINTNGKVEYVNPKFVETSGYKVDDFAETKSLNNLLAHPTYQLFQSILKFIKSGLTWEGEFLSKNKNGSTYWEHALAAPIKEENGKIERFVVLKEDITEKKKIFEELIAAKEEAVESSRAKGVFFANMSHELRTPLIGVLGYAEMLMYDQTNKETLEIAQVIYKSGKRLLDTLNMILDLSKGKNEAGQVNLIELEFNSFIEESFRLFEQSAKKKGLLYNLYKEKKHKYFVQSDPKLLSSIFNNLLNNAVKFTKTGKIELRVSANNENVILEVTDTGIGIPRESIDLVFQEFRQVSEGIGRAYGGTGLGLSIVKKYTDVLKGSISLKSTVGIGSTFTFTIPLLRIEIE